MNIEIVSIVLKVKQTFEKTIVQNSEIIKFIVVGVLAVLIDDWFKETFEKRSILDWKMLSNKYNISGIIVPSDWDLQIQEKIISKKFTAYILN